VPSRWIPTIRRTLIGVASYAVAIAIHYVRDTASVEIYSIAGLGVLVLILTDEYFTEVRPAKRIEELAPITLDGLVDPLISQLKDNSVVVRVNLMMACRTWRWCWTRRYFCMKWYRGMENQPDVNIIFPVGKGISGQCFQTKRPVYANPAALAQYPLPKRISLLTQHLQAVLSFPVFEPPGKRGIQSGRLLGVLNLDSQTPNAYDLLTSQAVLDQINQIMQTTASIAGRFFD
jgi:hypothetical protein